MLELNKKDFINALKTCFVTAGKNDVRFYLNSIQLEILENTIVMVGTDGHRVNICKLEVEGVDFGLLGRSVILCRNSIEQVLKSVKLARNDSESTLQLSLTDKIAEVKGVKTVMGFEEVKLINDGLSLSLAVIEGRYPDVHSIYHGKYTGDAEDAVTEIGFNINYLADIKKSFNHLVGKDAGVLITFNKDSGAARIKPTKFDSAGQLKEVVMYLMPVRK